MSKSEARFFLLPNGHPLEQRDSSSELRQALTLQCRKTSGDLSNLNLKALNEKRCTADIV